jgi:hypothetical protein
MKRYCVVTTWEKIKVQKDDKNTLSNEFAFFDKDGNLVLIDRLICIRYVDAESRKEAENIGLAEIKELNKENIEGFELQMFLGALDEEQENGPLKN